MKIFTEALSQLAEAFDNLSLGIECPHCRRRDHRREADVRGWAVDIPFLHTEEGTHFRCGECGKVWGAGDAERFLSALNYTLSDALKATVAGDGERAWEGMSDANSKVRHVLREVRNGQEREQAPAQPA